MSTSGALLPVLPHAEFVEQHDRVIDAPADRVWPSLHETGWADLHWTWPFIAARGLGRPRRGSSGGLLDSGPCPVVIEEPGHFAAGGFVGRPWRIVPVMGPRVTDIAELLAFDEPGWVVCVMDFRLHALPGGRTRLVTTTSCAPTDDRARRSFARYWRVIRPFSGLIRRDMLRAVAARAERGGSRRS